MPEPYRRLDTAVLEALLLKGPLGLTEDDIAHLHGPRLLAHRRRGAGSSCSTATSTSRSSCARAPVQQVRDIAAAGRQHAAEVDVLLPEGPDWAAVQPAAMTAVAASTGMKATATRDERTTGTPSRSASHDLSVDEPADEGGDDTGPEPAGAARREPRLVHRDHDGDVRRSARAGTSAASRSSCDYTPGRARLPDALQARRCASPTRLTDEQVERLRVIAAKCPVHRTLDGEVMFDERVERVTLATLTLRRASCARVLLDPAEAAALDVHGRTDAAVLVPLFVDATASCTPSSPAAATTCAATPARSRSPAGARTTTRPTCARPRCARPQEEIGLPPDAVELVGALQPTPTIATNYAVYPFVGLIEPGHAWTPAERRGRRGPRAAAARPARRLRAPAPAAPRRPVPHRRLRRRRPPHLGRDGAHARRPARAPPRGAAVTDTERRR